MEEEDDEVVEEEEEEEEVDEEEAEEEEEEEAIAVKDPEEYEYPIDSGPYQTSDYLDSFYDEKNHKPTTSVSLVKDSCKCSSFFLSINTLPCGFFKSKHSSSSYVGNPSHMHKHKAFSHL